MYTSSRSARFATPAAFALAAGMALPAAAVDKFWTCNSGTWSSANCWSPLGVPGPADVVRVGNLAGVHNQTVRLNMDDTVAGLHITDGMTFKGDGHVLTVNGPTTVSGRNVIGQQVFRSTLRLEQAGKMLDFETQSLTVTNDAQVRMYDSFLRVHGTFALSAGTILSGEGMVQLMGGGSNFINNGAIYPGASGGLLLTQAGAGTFDLDGTSGSGRVSLDGVGGLNLTLLGAGLTDPFSGPLVMAGDAHLHAGLSNGWAIDSAGSLYSIGGPGAGPARVSGSPLTFGGEIAVTGTDGHLRVQAPITFQPSARASLHVENRLEITGAAVVHGGTFTLAHGAVIDFQGATEVRGGSFSTANTLPSGGAVNFNGPTTWAGTVEFSGVARQHGHATVAAPTTIHADVFDMDGASPHSWAIQSNLTINASALDLHDNAVNGTINLTSGAGRLTVNLDGPGEAWTVAEVMNLSGQPGALHLPILRVVGSPVVVAGAVNVASGRPRINAPATFLPGATVSIVAAAAELRLDAASTVNAGVAFAGNGALAVGSAGALTLESGVTTGSVGLVNQGVLDVGAGAGVAYVDRFQNVGGATWRVSLGGRHQGDQHDHLIVPGGVATLGGTIEVDLIDLGGGVFRPQVGEHFTILSALGGVVGAFDSDPVTVIGTYTYRWMVEYGGSTVSLRLAAIEGCWADCDGGTGAGVLDIFDFLCFQNLFAAGDPYACDADTSTGSGLCDIFDFLHFQNAFAGGCP